MGLRAYQGQEDECLEVRGHRWGAGVMGDEVQGEFLEVRDHEDQRAWG